MHPLVRGYFAFHTEVLGVSGGFEEMNAAVAGRCFQYVTTRFMHNSEKVDDGEIHFETYPVEFWITHIRAASLRFQDEVDTDHEFFQPVSTVRDSWLSAYWPIAHKSSSSPERFSLIHFGAYAGVVPPFAKLLNKALPGKLTSAINTVDSMEMTPISYAAEYGHAGIVQAILQT